MISVEISREESHPLDRVWLQVILVLLVAGLVFFFGLTAQDLADNDETRFALFGRQMLGSGNFLYATWAGLPYTNKPPLLMWAIAYAGWFLGGVGTLAARLPSALAGLGTALLTLWLGRQLFRPRTGLLAALLFCTSYQVFRNSRLAQSDMLLTFFVLLAVAMAVAALQGSRGWAIGGFLGAYAASALAVLTKGPVGLLLPLMIVSIYLVVTRTWRKVPGWVHLAGLALFGVVAVPWYVLFASAVGQGTVWEALWRENVLRYLAGYDHIRPVWYYFPSLFLNFLPWSIALIPGLVYGFLQFRRPAMSFSSLWVVVVFIFFTVSSSKRSHFLLPLYPAASLLLAALIDEQLFALRGGWHRFVSRFFTTCMVLVTLISLGGSGVALWRFPEYAGAVLPLLGVGAVTGALAFWQSRLARWPEAFGLFVAGLVGLTVTASQWTFPPFVAPRSTVVSATRLAQVASGRPIVAYRFSKPSIEFFGGPQGAEVIYHHGPLDLRRLLESETPILVVMTRRRYEDLPEDIRQRLKPFDEHFRYGKHDVMVLVPS